MKNIILVTSALLLVAGCSTNPSIDSLSSQQRRAAAQVELMNGEPEKPYKIVGTIESLSCKRNAGNYHGSVSYDEAYEGLKIKAALLGANGVAYTFCQENNDTDWVNNCWASIKCVGDAVVVSE